jgi:hypothetical protein
LGLKEEKVEVPVDESLEASMRFLLSSTSQSVVQGARTLANLVGSTVAEMQVDPQESKALAVEQVTSELVTLLAPGLLSPAVAVVAALDLEQVVELEAVWLVPTEEPAKVREA